MVRGVVILKVYTLKWLLTACFMSIRHWSFPNLGNQNTSQKTNKKRKPTSHTGNLWWFPHNEIQAKTGQSGFPAFLSYLSAPSFLTELLIRSKLLLAEGSSKLQPGKHIEGDQNRKQSAPLTCLPWVKPSCPPPVLLDYRKCNKVQTNRQTANQTERWGK